MQSILPFLRREIPFHALPARQNPQDVKFHFMRYPRGKIPKRTSARTMEFASNVSKYLRRGAAHAFCA
jgi:hypothetical protein